MCKAAIAYADLGFLVLPLWSARDGRCDCGHAGCDSPGKHPHGRYAPHGLKDATKDGGTICNWFSNGYVPNIGIRTGKESNLLVIDVDGPAGVESLQQFGDLPRTATVQTGKGQHLYFRWPDVADDIRSKAGNLGKGLDHRANDGYVVAPPSQHVSGSEYKWLIDPRGGIADLPPAILARLREKPVTKTVPTVQGTIPNGTRDNTLTSLAGSMRRRGMSEASILAALREENKRCEEPLKDADLERIAKSIGKKPAADPGPATPAQCTPLIIRVKSDDMKRVHWLARNHFALGKLIILGGMPGAGKSLFVIWLVAAMQQTRGLPAVPPGLPVAIEQGHALLVSAEDDPYDTIGPRLAAYGVEPATLAIYRGTQIIEPDGTKTVALFDLGSHIAALDDLWTQDPEIKLLAIDPVQTYMGQADLNGNAAVNHSLAVLAEWAGRCGVCVILVTHFNKKSDQAALDRLTGSRGFSGTVRAAWQVTADPDEKGRCILCCTKQQNGPKPPAMAYRIKTTPVEIEGVFEDIPIIEFEPERIDADPDELVQRKADRGRLDECLKWLSKRLTSGAVLASTIFEEGEQQGFGRDLCYQAKAKLRVHGSKGGFQGRTLWSLPDEKGSA